MEGPHKPGRAKSEPDGDRLSGVCSCSNGCSFVRASFRLSSPHPGYDLRLGFVRLLRTLTRRVRRLEEARARTGSAPAAVAGSHEPSDPAGSVPTLQTNQAGKPRSALRPSEPTTPREAEGVNYRSIFIGRSCPALHGHSEHPLAPTSARCAATTRPSMTINPVEGPHTAMTAGETFDSAMAVIVFSDRQVCAALPDVGSNHEGFVMVNLAIPGLVCDDRFGVVMWGRQ